jgi:hypothetical protein
MPILSAKTVVLIAEENPQNSIENYLLRCGISAELSAQKAVSLTTPIVAWL